jgi:hypothetical protein
LSIFLIFSFEGVGKNKKEAEEQAAQKAFAALIELQAISADGKLVSQVSSHKTLQQSASVNNAINSLNNGPVFSEGNQTVSIEGKAIFKMNTFCPFKNNSNYIIALEALQVKFPNFKATLLNCFMKVSNHMKDANLILRPAFNRIGTGPNHRWKSSYSVKWPEPKEFSGIGNKRSEAERYDWFSFHLFHSLRILRFLLDGPFFLPCIG